MPRLRAAAICICFLVASSGLSATSVEEITFDELVGRAERIFVGRVVDVRSAWDGAAIRTHVTFRVGQTVKGRSSILVELTFLGGEVGDTALEVSGMPEFTVGDEHVIFSVEQLKVASPIVGFWHGQVRVVKDAAGRSRVLRHDRTSFARASALTQSASSATGRETPMTLDAFLADVRQAMRVRRPAR